MIKTISVHPSSKSIIEIEKSKSLPNLHEMGAAEYFNSFVLTAQVGSRGAGSLWNIWNIFIYPHFSLDCSKLGAPLKLGVADGRMKGAGKD